MRLRHVLLSCSIMATLGCGSDLSGLVSEDEYPYRVNLIFDLASDTSLECLQSAAPCQVRLKGNVTSRFGARVVGAQIYFKAAPATTFSQLVVTDQSGIFNISVTLERTGAGRAVTLCSGRSQAVAETGNCPTVSLQ